MPRDFETGSSKLNTLQEIVREKLHSWVLRYLESAKLVRFGWLVLTHEILRFTTLVAAGLAAMGILGVGPKVLDYVQGSTHTQHEATVVPTEAHSARGADSNRVSTVASPTPPSSQESSHSESPSTLADSHLATWFLVVVVFARALYEFFDVAKRAVLAKAGVARFAVWSHSVDTVLEGDDPLTELAKLQRKISDAVQHARDEEWWPWDDIFAPNDKIEAVVEARTNHLMERYKENLERQSVPTEQQRPKAPKPPESTEKS